MHKMRRPLLLAVLAFGVLAQAPSVWANVLGNGNFESEIGDGTGGNWDHTNGAIRVTNATLPAGGFNNVPQGTYALALNSGAGNFTFQTYDHVGAGDYVTFSGVAQTTIDPGVGGVGAQIVIEFKEILADGTDRLIGSVQSPFITTANAAAGGGTYVQFNIAGNAPAGTERVVFTIRTFGGAAGDAVFDTMNGEVKPAKLNVTASKNRVKVGDPVAIHAQFRNASGAALDNVQMFCEIPHGFDVAKNSVTLNGQKADYREGSLIVNAGTVASGQVVDVVYVLIPTSGVSIGKTYDVNVILVNGNQLSEKARVQLIVESDPLFDEGTLIGKVFNDTNQNGVQDQGETGVPSVRLAMETGVVIITDQDGKYHVPNVQPGRHIVKIDGHTLPAGTKFVTEESFVFRTTAGMMSKVNFAVLLPPSAIPEEFQKDLQVMITQGLDYSKPNLDIKMEPEVLRVGAGLLEKEPVFRFKTNYQEFVKKWYLEVRDEVGREVWTGFGVSAPPREVSWTGHTNQGLMIAPGIYSYRLKVADKDGHEDWTVLHFFRVFPKADSTELGMRAIDIPTVGDFNIFKDGKQTIPLVAKPTIRIQGKTRGKNQVTVNAYPVTVDPETGNFQTEVYTSPGEKEIIVTTTSPDGETTTYREKTTVKDSMFFMTGMAESDLGVGFTSGSVETAGDKDEFKDGFYQDGRIAYYLIGKVKGKFLVKSHYDSSQSSSSLFTSLDPEQYYPVYGDASQRDYEGQDSLQKFFIVVEMERSFFKWGSFMTEFKDTELATYNRTLSGAKLNYETKSTSSYGDAKRGFKAFRAKSANRADHNEFAATGGSLYYLRYRRVIQGSEKIRVEIRDKIQNMAVESRDLTVGTDYEIDYDEGRIMLSRPLSSVAASDTLVSRDVMDGDSVYLTVDYEYDAENNAYEDVNQGVRGYTYVGDHLRVGATAVEEERQSGNNYEMRAVDATLKLGRNTKMTAEYAQTQEQQVRHAVSYNGGLSFADQPPLTSSRLKDYEGAYLLKGETKPIKNLEVAGYVQGVDPSFSTDRIRSQEGFQKYGVSSLLRLHPNAYLRYRYDSSQLVSDMNPLLDQGFDVPYDSSNAHTVQAVFDDHVWLAQAEYLRQVSKLPSSTSLISTLISEIPYQNAIAVKFGRRINDRLLPYVKTQINVGGKTNQQFGGGVRYDVTRDICAYIEEMVGNTGDSTYFGFEKQEKNGGRTYANLSMGDRGIGTRTLMTAIGSTFPLTKKSRIFTEREYSTYSGQDGYADILGVSGNPKDRWDYEVKFERRNLSNHSTRLLDVEAAQSLLRTNTFNVVSGAIGYANGKKFRMRSALEARRDQDIIKMWQIASRNSVDYQINQDLTFKNVLKFGIGRFTDPDDRAADFMEINTGFAYRPVAFDRFNALTRYTYTRDISNDAQFQNEYYNDLDTNEIAHIVSLDLSYDLHRYLGIVEKIGYKRSFLSTGLSTKNVVLNSFLWGHRFNIHVTRKWDIGLEYRILWQSNAVTNMRQGTLVEIDREFFEYARLGVGYNFTDFDDDLRKSTNFDHHGPFVRLTGKF